MLGNLLEAEARERDETAVRCEGRTTETLRACLSKKTNFSNQTDALANRQALPVSERLQPKWTLRHFSRLG